MKSVPWEGPGSAQYQFEYRAAATPSDATIVLLNRWQRAMMASRFEDAVAAAESLVAVDGSANSQGRLADALFSTQQWAAAADHYEQAAKLLEQRVAQHLPAENYEQDLARWRALVAACRQRLGGAPAAP